MKYTTKPEPKLWLDDYGPGARSTINVLESDQAPQDTGLLNIDGLKIFRVPEQRAIGFTARWDEKQ